MYYVPTVFESYFLPARLYIKHFLTTFNRQAKRGSELIYKFYLSRPVELTFYSVSRPSTRLSLFDFSFSPEPQKRQVMQFFVYKYPVILLSHFFLYSFSHSLDNRIFGISLNNAKENLKL